MLPVKAYLGFEHPVVWQALAHLESAFKVHALPIEQFVGKIEEQAVFICAPGKFPGEYLKTFFAPTPEEQERRRQKLHLRDFDLPELALCSPYLVVLKEPQGKERQHSGMSLHRFEKAVVQACGFVPLRRESALARAERLGQSIFGKLRKEPLMTELHENHCW